jgi:hypothetical protein
MKCKAIILQQRSKHKLEDRTELRGFGRLANYADRATALVGKVVPTFAERVLRGQRNGSHRSLVSVFLTGVTTISSK